MKNRKLLYYILFIFTLIQYSCSDDTVNLLPIGDTEATYFQNESQMEEGIRGIYQKLGFFYRFGGSQNDNTAPIWHLPSDDLTTPSTNALENFSGLNGSNWQVTMFYTYAYQLINRANYMLQKIEENADFAYKKQPELKNFHKGEALFLRAYMYMQLWNVFGTAPLVTERITKIADGYLPNSKDTELLDQAIEDLAEAAQLLPDSWSADMKGRVTKNSAYGLRGKCLVFRGSVKKATTDFTEAITDFNKINSASLAPKYSQNFDVNFENNQESLFEYQANSSPSDVNPFLDNDNFAVIGEIGAYYGFFTQKPSWIGNSYYTATASIKDAYNDGDFRRTYNIDLNPDVKLNVKKYIRNTAYAKGWGGQDYELSVNNPRILRYADVLLLKAEAIVRSNGSLSEAIGLINQIRERARNSGDEYSEVPADRNVNETDPQKVLEWIFEERRLELAFEEGHRWWDLRRRHIAGEIDLKSWDFQSLDPNFKFEDYNVNFPLPEQEVVENPNMNQNVGY